MLELLRKVVEPVRGEGLVVVVQERTGEDVVCCFVPTTPNPTSGFVIMVPRKEIRVLDMDVDEALKMIISLGVVVPTWRGDQTRELPFQEPPSA